LLPTALFGLLPILFLTAAVGSPLIVPYAAVVVTSAAPVDGLGAARSGSRQGVAI
jgi:hypothetical protein